MSIDIVRGSSRKPVASRTLADLMSNETDFSGQFFVGFPVISTPEGPHSIDALLVSADKGIVLFDLIEGPDPEDYKSRQDDSANRLEAQLKKHRELMNRRNLLIDIHTISFAPGVNRPYSYDQDNGYPLVDTASLRPALKKFEWEQPNIEIYKKALAAIESISTIRKSGVNRTNKKPDSRGYKLKNLEDSIATLDREQRRAVIETAEGIQRIRGLAGSGKTIVLALKAAYLHAQHPEWRIGITFYTRSLKGHFRRLIERFAFEQTGEEPNWENLRIIHAWGAPGGPDRDGIYSQYCRIHGITYFDFRMASNAFGRENAFAGACEHALGEARENKQYYDAILVDEAQDFSPAFLRLCYESLKDSKRLVYAYDELQNLSGNSLPSPEEIFGKHADGTPKERFDDAEDEARRDIILKKCYRNSRPVLVTAHALGFGIYREAQQSSGTGLIQMFDHPELWEEIGYQTRDGKLKEGTSVTLYRPEETSPKFLEDHSDIDDLIQFIPFDSKEAQADWLANEIKKNLEEDELQYEDIIVINPDPLTTRSNVGLIRGRLQKMGINSHLAGVDTDPNTFFQTGKNLVTFAGISRAKGNEAGMVYIINTQDCHSALRNLASIRNRLFTAITRSKAWIRVLGVGSKMKEITKEYDKLKSQAFNLQFTYPTESQRKQLQIVHRDMTTAERDRLKKRQKSLFDLIEDIESGSIHIEDLDETAIARLREFLIKKSE